MSFGKLMDSVALGAANASRKRRVKLFEEFQKTNLSHEMQKSVDLVTKSGQVQLRNIAKTHSRPAQANRTHTRNA